MPITFSVTCDTDEELARFLESLTLEKALLGATRQKAKRTRASTATPPAKVAAGRKLAKTPRTGTLKKASVKKSTAPTTRGKKAGVTKSATTKAKPGRKPGTLLPIIQGAIAEMIQKGQPFRNRDVVDLVMKKSPNLHESSVITGVSKALNGTQGLKWQQVKDVVGRPYKLFKP